jgi:hypothetical protein
MILRTVPEVLPLRIRERVFSFWDAQSIEQLKKVRVSDA